eukprot:Skav213628  [mRNA]  locus=scaffold4520:21655:36616:- [translate_table: standard]
MLLVDEPDPVVVTRGLKEETRWWCLMMEGRLALGFFLATILEGSQLRNLLLLGMSAVYSLVEINLSPWNSANNMVLNRASLMLNLSVLLMSILGAWVRGMGDTGDMGPRVRNMVMILMLIPTLICSVYVGEAQKGGDGDVDLSVTPIGPPDRFCTITEDAAEDATEVMVGTTVNMLETVEAREAKASKKTPDTETQESSKVELHGTPQSSDIRRRRWRASTIRNRTGKGGPTKTRGRR